MLLSPLILSLINWLNKRYILWLRRKDIYHMWVLERYKAMNHLWFTYLVTLCYEVVLHAWTLSIFNLFLIWHTVSRRVDEVIPSDHSMVWSHPWDMIQYPRWHYYYDNMFIIYLFPTFWFYKLFWSLIQKKCGNVCHYVSFLDVTSSCFPSLVPCLKFTLCNVTAKTGNRS